MSNKLVLIDGNSILFRAFYALPLLHNEKGIYTNAVYGFTTMLMKILEEEKPTNILVAFDAGKTTFRHETYKDYKAGRQKTPHELSEQFPMTKELLDAFDVPYYELDNYEADDIIGTLAYNAKAKDWKVKIISGDQDMLQLVSDEVTVDLTRRGITDVDSYTPTFLEEKMEITPDQVIDLKALMGDNSDNIPGVPGVGIKTATRLLKEYGTLDNIYKNIDNISGKRLKENLLEHKDAAYMSRDLVTIHLQSPIEVTIDETDYEGFDNEKVYQFFKDLDFKSLLSRVSDGVEEASDDLADIEYTVVDKIDETMFTGEDALIIEMLTDNYHEADIEVIGISNENGHYIIPTDIVLQSDVFKQWAEDETKEKFVFDAKKVKVALLNKDIDIQGITFDILLGSYLLNPAENHHDIPAIAQRRGYMSVDQDEAIYGKGAKLALPEFDVLAEHVARKTSLIPILKKELEKELQENNQYELYQELEMPLAIILAKMEYQGIQVDIERLKNMGKELTERLEQIEKDVYALAGEEFNLNSPRQLGPILFEKLELPVIRKTKTGYSTAADVLEKLKDEHEIIPHILLYRQLKKLDSTYIKGLLKVVHKDTNKIHTRFNQALTQTGRLSSIEPNLQNIPIRLEEGRKIREAFIPSEEDWVIFAADYSQIELRVLAHIAEDERLIDAFLHDLDIHSETAKDVFHVEREAVTNEMREQAKAVNFGIIYGISDYGLSQNLGITRKEAKSFIDRYLETYPGVKKYMEDIVQEAKYKGYVTTLMNRRRYLPEITSRNFNMRSFAERTAMNTPIQGSAADIIKKAMIDLQLALEEKNFEARILLQVHDELILEVPKDEIDELKEVVTDVMENTVELAVPLKVDYTYGESWFDAD